MNSKNEKLPKFEIDASVVYELGEKLISDEVQALIELVKNSFDADASYAKVTVVTNEAVGSNSIMFPDSLGFITIEDDGTGMSWDTIVRGWLTISSSPKKEMKAKGKTTIKGRTPLGDKGLGRLGSQKLGQRIEIWTSEYGNDIEYYIGIDWGDFKNTNLSNVPIHSQIFSKKPSKNGTKVLISGLNTPEKWVGAQQNDLINKISQLLFPFEELRPFDVYLTVNGSRIDLSRVSKNLFNVADAKYSFIFDGNQLCIKGKYRLVFLLDTTSGEGTKENYKNLIEIDRGADFFSFLEDKKSKTMPELLWLDEPGWYVAFNRSYSIDEIPELELVKINFLQKDKGGVKNEIANPGPFNGTVYSFKRKGADLSSIKDVFSESEFSKYIERHSGVRVFRNGFGIRPFGIDGNDWLQLGSGWTSARSFYGLRPANVVGYISLTTDKNKNLEEATDREGFVESGYSRNFTQLLQKVVETITAANTKLRRGYNDYIKYRGEQNLGIVNKDTKDVFFQMRNTASQSSELVKDITIIRSNLENINSEVKAVTQQIEKYPVLYSDEERNINPLLQGIRNTLDKANTLLLKVEEILAKAKQLGDIANIIEPNIEYLQNELDMFSELAGLGITAEVLSHEMNIIADNLSAHTKDLLRKLKDKQIKDPQVIAYTENVYTAVGRIKKQLTHLDPSMRYIREQNDIFSVLTFFNNIHDFYFERFERNKIDLVIDVPFDNFEIQINKGKITQVVDNLLINSEYWLTEGLRIDPSFKPQIFIRSQSPYIDIFDNGPGISPSVEDYLFQPFTTTKPKGKGRGLGLFISRQLLESSGCAISLLPERNRIGRRYIFRIDLSGVITNA